MKILFAYNLRKNDNDFVKIHVKLLSDLGYVVVNSRKEFWRPTTIYDIVIISWPESLFGWKKKIANAEVAKLNHSIERFRSSKTRIFTFFHDEYSHLSRTGNRNLIFDICYGKSDALIHLGKYSRDKYQKIYNRASHPIIHHPLYEDFIFNLGGLESRQQLGIAGNEFLVIVPGSIRKHQEIEYAIKVFRSIDIPIKRLVFLRTAYLAKPQMVKSFAGIKSWFSYFILKAKYRYVERVFFLHGFMKAEKLSQYFSACDAVIIPRIDIMNSGNIILAAQFGKTILGAGKGNMKELLNFLMQTVIPRSRIPNPIILSNDLNEGSDRQLTIKRRIVEYAGDEVIIKQWLDLLGG